MAFVFEFLAMHYEYMRRVEYPTNLKYMHALGIKETLKIKLKKSVFKHLRKYKSGVHTVIYIDTEIAETIMAKQQKQHNYHNYHHDQPYYFTTNANTCINKSITTTITSTNFLYNSIVV